MVVYGASAGDLTSVPVRSLFALKTMAGFSLLAWRAYRAEQARADITELAEVVRAHQLLEDRAVLGRIILVP